MASAARDKLSRDGYLIAREYLGSEMLTSLRAKAAHILANLSKEHREQFKATGSLCNFGDYSGFSEIVALPDTAKVMEELGFASYKWLAGYFISKPGFSPPLFWHQDWWGWSNGVSYHEKPLGLGFMYYLSDTSPENGALKIIPGSHRAWHELHDLPQAHAAELSAAKDLEHPTFQPHPDEVTVRVNAGDLVIMDSRLLHGAHANSTAQERSLLTLWYLPEFESMPVSIQNRFCEIFARTDLDIDAGEVKPKSPLDWPEQSRAEARHLFPLCDTDGPEEPWNRKPARVRMLEPEL